MMLEIINSCLCNSLHHNPNLVYALLYKRELFEQFRTHPSFQDIMQNLDTVSLAFFPGCHPNIRHELKEVWTWDPIRNLMVLADLW